MAHMRNPLYSIYSSLTHHITDPYFKIEDKKNIISGMFKFWISFWISKSKEFINFIFLDFNKLGCIIIELFFVRLFVQFEDTLSSYFFRLVSINLVFIPEQENKQERQITRQHLHMTVPLCRFSIISKIICQKEHQCSYYTLDIKIK